jgi:hypothetical protein
MEQAGANPEVDRLIEQLSTGIKSGADFHARDGVSAVLTFAYRFLGACILLSGSQESREQNTKEMAKALRGIAARLETDNLDVAKQTVH